LPGFLQIQAGPGDLKIKHPKYRRSRHAVKGDMFIAYIVSHGPTGPVGPQGQRNPGFRSGHDMKGIGTVTGVINIFIGCSQAAIHCNGSCDTQLKTGSFRYLATGCDADSHQHHVSGEI